MFCLCCFFVDHLPFLSLPTAGLSQLPAVDDGASGPLNIPINFLFDGVTQDTVYVSVVNLSNQCQVNLTL